MCLARLFCRESGDYLRRRAMRSIARLAVFAVALLLVGCAHRINISPPLNTLGPGNAGRIDKTVGYYISAADKAKEIVTPGGGGDKVKYLPYEESEPALKQVLANIFSKIVPVPSLEDKQFITTNEIVLIFIPSIATDSSSDS